MPDSDSHLDFKKLSQEVIFNSYRKIIEKRFAMPNQQEGVFEIMHTNYRTAIVAAFDTNGNLVLVRQYRPGPEKILIELPSGMIEEGENDLEGARRELLEETGYITDDIMEIGNFYGGAYSDGVFIVFLARNCVKISNQELDQTEFIDVLTWSQAEFEKYYGSNRSNGQNLLGYFLAKPFFEAVIKS